MNFQTAVITGFKKYWHCSDRASRSEYWWWTLFSALAPIPFMVIDEVFLLVYVGEFVIGPSELVVQLGLFAPSFFVMIRRLHDINRSGYWWMISLTVIGLIPLFYWMIKKGTPGDNRFGADPLASNLFTTSRA
jgi:uncharacterized membrane protein YhaH (DUF805 family)